jgi:hypothetical protein
MVQAALKEIHQRKEELTEVETCLQHISKMSEGAVKHLQHIVGDVLERKTERDTLSQKTKQRNGQKWRCSLDKARTRPITDAIRKLKPVANNGLLRTSHIAQVAGMNTTAVTSRILSMTGRKANFVKRYEDRRYLGYLVMDEVIEKMLREY